MKRKCGRMFSLMLIFIFMFSFTTVYADTKKTKKINVNARCAVALDAKSKVVLYEKNADMIVPMASTTKILTSLVAIKYGDLEKEFKVSPKAASVRGSKVGYSKGQSVKLKELLFGLMLRSGNDAAITIAEGMAGSIENFCKLMNEYAVEIGALNSHFESPHGLDSNHHYSTAYDLAIITAKAKENKIFNEIVSTKDIDASKYNFTRSYHNINKILYQIPQANGVKTGYTGGAGKCLVTSVNVNGRDVIIVVLNCTPRWKETKKIYDYVVENYEYKNIAKKDEIVDEFVYGEKKNKVQLLTNNDIVIPIKKSNECNIKVVRPSNLDKFNVVKGQKVGEICVYNNEKLIYSEPLRVSTNIKGYNKIKSFFKW